MDEKFENKVRVNFAEALNGFNFANVYEVMNHLGWCWCNENHSPTQIQMIQAVEDLFEHAIKGFEDSYSYVASGGFLVRICESGKVKIQFIAEESESFEEEE